MGPPNIHLQRKISTPSPLTITSSSNSRRNSPLPFQSSPIELKQSPFPARYSPKNQSPSTHSRSPVLLRRVSKSAKLQLQSRKTETVKKTRIYSGDRSFSQDNLTAEQKAARIEAEWAKEAKALYPLLARKIDEPDLSEVNNDRTLSAIMKNPEFIRIIDKPKLADKFDNPYVATKIKDLVTKINEIADSQMVIGLDYLYGSGPVSVNRQKAFCWLNKAALKKNQLAEYLIGSFYMHGVIVPRDLVKAEIFLQAAASHRKKNPGAEELLQDLQKIKLCQMSDLSSSQIFRIFALNRTCKA